MRVDTRILVIGILYIVKFIFGFWLYRTSKPYNGLILTIHKLVSLATLVYIVVIANRIRLDIGLTMLDTIVISITVLFFLISIATGGYLSTDAPANIFIAGLHKVIPFLSILSTAAAVYFLVLTKSL